MLAGSLEVQMFANIARLTDDMNKAKSMVGGAMKNIEGAVGAAKSALGALGIGLSVGYFVNLIKGSIDAMDHMNDLSKSTGIAVETLSGLQLAAKQSGGDLDSIAASITKLQQNIGKDPEKYRALGVSAKDGFEAFKQLSDIFVSIQDPQQRAALGAAALGKSWTGAAPALSEGSKALQEMVNKGTALSGITKANAEEADKLNDQLEEMKTRSDAVGVSIATSLIPALTRALKAFQDAREEGDGLLSVWKAIRAFGKMDEKQWNMRQMTETAEKIFELEGAMANFRSIPGQDKQDLANLKRKFEAHKAIVEAMEAEEKLIVKPKPKTVSTAGVAGFLSGEKDEAERKKKMAEYIRITNLVEADRERMAKEAAELDAHTLKVQEDLQRDREKMLADGLTNYFAYLDAKYDKEVEDGQRLLQMHLDTTKEMNEFWKSAAQSMQRSMSDFFFDVMTGNLNDLAGNFGRTLQRMAADMLAAKAAVALFGKDFGKDGVDMGGLFGAGLSKLGGLFGSQAPAPVVDMSFASGTNYVPHTGLALVHKGEQVIPAGQSNGTYYIDARNADAGGLARLEGLIRSLNGSIENRAVSAVADARTRGAMA